MSGGFAWVFIVRKFKQKNINCWVSCSVFSHYFTTWRSCKWKEKNTEFVQLLLLVFVQTSLCTLCTHTYTHCNAHVYSLFYLYEHKYVELLSTLKEIKVLKKRKPFVYCLHIHKAQWTCTVYKSQTMDSLVHTQSTPSRT